MIETIWETFLYQPVFNALIWIYNNWTDQNFGLAVILLTVSLRMLLLPFTVANEKTAAENEASYAEVEKLKKIHANDPILMKEEIRKALRKRKLRPWAKAVVLGIQALVLLLLYQVFVNGIKGDRMLQMLYYSVDYPGQINTFFLGFDLRMSHDWVWSGAVLLFLMVEIYFGYKKSQKELTKRDLAFFWLFPIAVFLTLYFLPMVKSLFVLTSMLFSVIVGPIIRPFLRIKVKGE